MWSRRWVAIGVAITALGAIPDAGGLERAVRTRIANYDKAPVTLRHAAVELVQTFSTPTQFPLSAVAGQEDVNVRRSRVRYMNRLGQQVPSYLLQGELELANETRKEVAALQITTVFLNAFRERISTDRYALSSPLAPRKTIRMPWSRSLPHEEVFEMFFVITAVRFADGTVWAPAEELILLP